MKKLFNVMCLTGIALLIGSAIDSYAITLYIGDVDGFGFGDISGKNYIGRVMPNDFSVSIPADRNGNGIFDEGDVLPDLDNNGWTGRGDDFDHRSTDEKTATNGAQHTDISFDHRFISPRIEFNFTVDANDSYYGQTHEISFLYGDYDLDPMYVIVEGKRVDLVSNTDRSLDAYIGLMSTEVAWEDMLDGKVVVQFFGPNEPWVAFDYFKLSHKPGIPPSEPPNPEEPPTPSPVPEPGTMLLLGIGIAGLLGLRLKKRS